MMADPPYRRHRTRVLPKQYRCPFPSGRFVRCAGAMTGEMWTRIAATAGIAGGLARLGAPVLALLTFVVMQILAEPLPSVGPPALEGEYGIVLVAVLGIVLGSAALRRAPHPPRELAR